MQKRVRKIVSFLAFNTLFFAVYLNLIHKTDRVQDNPVQQTAAFSSAILSGQHLVKPGSPLALNK